MNTDLQAVARSHQVTLFFVLAIAFTWTAHGIEIVTGRPLIPIGVLGPILAAALLTWVTGGSLRQWAGQVLIWRTGLRWYLIAIVGLPVVLVVSSTVLIVVLTGDPPRPELLPERTGLIVGYFFFQLFLQGGLEEFGWRGFALPRLQERYTALVASIVIGVVWALWHAPLFFVPGTFYSQIPPVLYLLQTIGTSVMITWVYNSTGGSVLLAMAFHAANNVSMLLYPWEIDIEVIETPLAVDVSMTIVYLAVGALLVVVYGGGKLTNRETIPGTEHTGGVPANRTETAGTD
ncbi:CPBP family intramembrane glutamic endopeptidase [Natrialba sp. INN-245]|uniref:CPBP family intramembrane glutamic endopeptidase n=1 Tax=Natrialba sp. INN-245 TaxID=2690967 RepID=UPI0013122960|nr:CPBP family intramembrane glutamic endopeptidase [Natrialba sp. INN-245]MWV39076.1 CPBP family intramembrane metalloprotease [Natrialba sp. INN-245]